jgi:Cof subfamily protein (haloacid dehalogenase superfamily)
MSGIRLIVSDLDGTLLSPENELTESVIHAVMQFRAAGGLFTIATGRFGPSAAAIVEQLELDIPYILCNGSVIADNHKIWASAALTLDELAPFLLDADRQGITVMMFADSGIQALRRTESVDMFENREHVPCRIIDPARDDWRQTPVQKVLLIGEMPRIKGLWDEHQPGYRHSYTTIQSEDDFLEIIPPNQSKGKALNKLMEILKVEPSEVMALGNQLNDMDMICNAGIGVAVANSHPELLRAADYVCALPNGDGVVEAMGRFAIGACQSGGEAV